MNINPNWEKATLALKVKKSISFMILLGFFGLISFFTFFSSFPTLLSLLLLLSYTLGIFLLLLSVVHSVKVSGAAILLNLLMNH